MIINWNNNRFTYMGTTSYGFAGVFVWSSFGSSGTPPFTNYPRGAFFNFF